MLCCHVVSDMHIFLRESNSQTTAEPCCTVAAPQVPPPLCCCMCHCHGNIVQKRPNSPQLAPVTAAVIHAEPWRWNGKASLVASTSSWFVLLVVDCNGDPPLSEAVPPPHPPPSLSLQCGCLFTCVNPLFTTSSPPTLPSLHLILLQFCWISVRNNNDKAV